MKVHAPGVDSEAAWIKKGKKAQFGYKKHVVTNSDVGLVLGVLTTSVNINEISNLEDVLKKFNYRKEPLFMPIKDINQRKIKILLKKIISRILYKAYKKVH